MAACSSLEDKSPSSKDTLPLQIFVPDAVNHVMRENCYREFSNANKNSETLSKVKRPSQTGDLKKLSIDEFQDLLEEASTFNKPNNQESSLLKQLREEVSEAEPRENSSSEHGEVRSETSTLDGTSSVRGTLETKKKQVKNKDDCLKGFHQSHSLQDLMSSDSPVGKQKSHKTQRTLSRSDDASDRRDETNGPSDASGKEAEMMPYPPIINPCDIPLPDEAPFNPMEIEMEEIKHSSKEGKKSQQSNSQFYVDYKDIDTTVSFPVKIVSNVDEQGSSIESMTDQIKRQISFPVAPWPGRQIEVRSFFSPLETDLTRNDKQLLNTDVNGNPFSKSRQNAGLASLVSSSLLDYGGSGLLSESKNRKNKRQRNMVDKGVLSEEIKGHRGKDDIDTLLEFINSSDINSEELKSKKVKSIKGSILNEGDKKKSVSKEIKNCHKNLVVKKKISLSNSVENLMSDMNDDVARVFSLGAKNSPPLLKNSEGVDNFESGPLDVNSNVETEGSDKGKDSSGTEESGIQSPAFRQSSPELSSFAADFYSTADVSSQTVEESGFLIVKKKQRKKHQSKRLDSYRWRMAQTQCKKGIMLPLAESKCGKQDSRRKSTSSVPHSDHSSADNSDLDSVHSLPVRGSVPHPKQTHPHTTPSSSSSTPQASYADIARMPISKLNSPSTCMTTFGTRTTKQCNGNTNCGPSKWRTDDREDDLPLTTEMRVRSCSKSTREINTQTEPCFGKECKRTEDKHICSCLQKKSSCSCTKVHRQKPKSCDMPPVIMDDVPPGANPCDVSFGFGIEEVLKMTPPAERLSVNSEMSPVDRPGSRTRKTDIYHEPSSHCRTVCYGTGRNLCYTETKVNTKKFNLSEIASFFGKEFQCIEREIGVSRTNSRVMYYAEEA